MSEIKTVQLSAYVDDSNIDNPFPDGFEKLERIEINESERLYGVIKFGNEERKVQLPDLAEAWEYDPKERERYVADPEGWERNRQLSELLIQMDERDSRIGEMSERMDTMQAQLDALISRNSVLEDAVRDHDTRIADRDIEIEGLKSSLEDMCHDRSATMTGLRRRNAELEEDNRNKGDQIIRLQTQLEERSRTPRGPNNRNRGRTRDHGRRPGFIGWLDYRRREALGFGRDHRGALVGVAAVAALAGGGYLLHEADERWDRSPVEHQDKAVNNNEQAESQNEQEIVDPAVIVAPIQQLVTINTEALNSYKYQNRLIEKGNRLQLDANKIARADLRADRYNNRLADKTNQFLLGERNRDRQEQSAGDSSPSNAAASYGGPTSSSREYPWTVAHKKAPGDEVDLLKKAVSIYSKRTRQPVQLVKRAGNTMIQVGKKIVNWQQIHEINSIITSLK